MVCHRRSSSAHSEPNPVLLSGNLYRWFMMKLRMLLCSPRNSIMFLVTLTSSSSKSLDTVRAKMKEKIPRTISKGRLIEPNTKMKAKVRAALSRLMMKERMTKYSLCSHVDISNALTKAFFPKSRSDFDETLSMCCRSFLARCGSVRCKISVTSDIESSSLGLAFSMAARTFSASWSTSVSREPIRLTGYFLPSESFKG